jgi:hypothetical protein
VAIDAQRRGGAKRHEAALSGAQRINAFFAQELHSLTVYRFPANGRDGMRQWMTACQVAPEVSL